MSFENNNKVVTRLAGAAIVVMAAANTPALMADLRCPWRFGTTWTPPVSGESASRLNSLSSDCIFSFNSAARRSCRADSDVIALIYLR